MPIYTGDCLSILPTIPAQSIQCCVTSPPYFNLRDYGIAGQVGQEPTPDAYVAKLVAVFREVRRALRDDGTVWLNLGDSYAASTKGSGGHTPRQDSHAGAWLPDRRSRIPDGLKPKDLIGIPWRVAFALQSDGWWLRSDIIYAKPNPMPESCKDRPTSSYEHVFLLSKRATYFYDADAIAEPSVGSHQRGKNATPIPDRADTHGDHGQGVWGGHDTRNARNVWTITPKPFKGAHFATMPIELAERCIKAGTRQGDTVLDPFGGAGTTALAAAKLGRESVLIELSPAYVEMAVHRLNTDM